MNDQPPNPYQQPLQPQVQQPYSYGQPVQPYAQPVAPTPLVTAPVPPFVNTASAGVKQRDLIGPISIILAVIVLLSAAGLLALVLLTMK